MNLNPTFVSNICDIYGKEGKSWLNQLPTQLKRLSAKWNLRFIEVMHDLTYHFVGVVELLETGEKAIIKIAASNERLTIESRWLQCFSDGVAKFYWYDEAEHALLMERLEPGYSLKQLVKDGKDDLATRIICQEIQNLQTHQEPKYEFKHLSELIKNLSVLKGLIDDKLLSKAVSLFHDLSSDKTHDIILHGDLHHDNILASSLTWKTIDPHGYIGDPVFEVGSMIFNPYDCFPNHQPINKIIERRLKILIEELPFDAQRIKAWTFCKTILSVAWTFEDHGKIDQGEVEIAQIIDRIKV